VNDPLLVRRLERIGDVDADLEELPRFERSDVDTVLQGHPLEQLHHDEGLPLVLSDVVNRADVGVVEGGGGLRLSSEALYSGRVAEDPIREKLQRDGSVQPGVLGLVDHTHPPAAELLDDPVVGDGLADHVQRPPFMDGCGFPGRVFPHRGGAT